ncbi:L-threonylcarbamoyladenylate synthase [Marinithermus hydrothermalis]|uniref:L-threonylcarbamoyladenylate synthase n=1 Tax=Marinithermus hydrothermalis (strain DSM 14884 / JCM 11576 / T1) TaxID=869210 RepID=F2NL90_MARHT|nr:L-threonylcarbamoyladenylate synthase [Marinithermus hydrothermalis]AEB11709.1 Sua5/YciO/YrdC/YwlC family protein [Marinithermus hydrothermalis DSM 14884]
MNREAVTTLQVLRNGGVVAFPTDTVWGLLARMEDEAACRRIYRIKGRAAEKPLQVLVSSVEAALELAELGPHEPVFLELAREFWPGPLTIVVPGQAIPPWISPDGTVGLRMPAHDELLEILAGVGGHAAATSLNQSGAPPARSYEEALTFAPLVDRVHPGDTPAGVASSVVDLVRGQVLREGGVPASALKPHLRRPE